MKYYDVIIIGGGASGLACAVMSKTNSNSVLIIEHKDRVGKKILSTGNGRCNLTNTFCTLDLFDKNPEGIYPYFTKDKFFVNKIISEFDSNDTVNFFEKLGLLTTSIEGYIYPRSFQASSVLDILRLTCEKIGVEILLETEISEIKKGDVFLLNDEFSCKKLVIACGGKAAPKFGSDGSMFKFILDFGHSIIEPLPALCSIKCGDRFLKSIAGVRNFSSVSLIADKRKLISSSGNLQFTTYGVSGIPAFQISRVVSEILSENKVSDSTYLCIDLLPEFSEDEIFEKVKINPSLIGIINKKLATLILKLAKFDLSTVVKILKNFRLKPVGTASFIDAQVTAGGVSVKEINPDSMESVIVPGLYFTGEVIDVDGICGGYNLQWAFSTAAVCAANIR